MAEYNVSEADGSVSVRISQMQSSTVAVMVLFSTVNQTATGVLNPLGKNNIHRHM